jgi:hypothetical protein
MRGHQFITRMVAGSAQQQSAEILLCVADPLPLFAEHREDGTQSNYGSLKVVDAGGASNALRRRCGVRL